MNEGKINEGSEVENLFLRHFHQMLKHNFKYCITKVA